MTGTRERLGEDISELMLGGDMTERDQAIQELLPDKVTIQLDVLRPFMEDRIFGYVNCSLVVTLDGKGSEICNGQLMKQPTEPGQFSNQSSEASVLSFS